MRAIERILRRLRLDEENGCWLWPGAVGNHGYGVVGLGGRDEGTGLVHRVAYEWAFGPIPEGYEVDHLCRVRRCFFPGHLEAVTKAENLRRQHEEVA